MVATLWAGQAFALCEPTEGPRFTPTMASRFVKNPTRMLGSDITEYGLSSFTMQYAAARSRDLDVFSTLLSSANRKQKDAVALGLARTVIFCRPTDPDVSDRIARWVAKLPMQDVVASYQQVVALKDDQQTYQPVDMTPPAVEERFGDGLELLRKPSATGVGSLDIPDPKRLPGD